MTNPPAQGNQPQQVIDPIQIVNALQATMNDQFALIKDLFKQLIAQNQQVKGAGHNNGKFTEFDAHAKDR